MAKYVMIDGRNPNPKKRIRQKPHLKIGMKVESSKEYVENFKKIFKGKIVGIYGQCIDIEMDVESRYPIIVPMHERWVIKAMKR